MQFAQAYPGATAVLVDKFDAGQLQRAPNRQVVSSRHRRLAVGQLGAATGRIGAMGPCFRKTPAIAFISFLEAIKNLSALYSGSLTWRERRSKRAWRTRWR